MIRRGRGARTLKKTTWGGRYFVPLKDVRPFYSVVGLTGGGKRHT